MLHLFAQPVLRSPLLSRRCLLWNMLLLEPVRAAELLWGLLLRALPYRLK
jgi:hypothetical protein